jgi:hypothetical protein
MSLDKLGEDGAVPCHVADRSTVTKDVVWAVEKDTSTHAGPGEVFRSIPRRGDPQKISEAWPDAGRGTEKGEINFRDAASSPFTLLCKLAPQTARDVDLLSGAYPRLRYPQRGWASGVGLIRGLRGGR